LLRKLADLLAAKAAAGDKAACVLGSYG